MTDFTRLTIVGGHRKAELVVPNDESIGALIPRLMELLDEKTGSVVRPLTLIRSTGEQLDVALTAAEQQVSDGELLRLVRQDEAPPPPEVADVTDVLADSRIDRAGLWNDTSRAVTGAAAIGSLSFIAADLALGAPFVPSAGASAAGATLLDTDPLTALAVALGAMVVLTLTGVLLGRLGFRWASIAAIAASLGLAVPTAGIALSSFGSGGPAAVDVTVIGVLLAWLVIAVGIGIGHSNRAALWGGVLGAALSALPIVLSASAVPVLGVAAVTSVVAVIACGLIPWFAMSVSGLTGLDDQVVEGRLRRRDSVLLTVNGAYRTLSWSTVAVAIPIAGGASVLVVSDDGWAVALGVAVALVTCLRTRAFPLAVQSMALWSAVLVIAAVGLIFSPLLEPAAAVGILVVAAFASAIVVGVQPAAHQRASLRRTGNLLEGISVVALIPLLLGVFHVYEDLLGAF